MPDKATGSPSPAPPKNLQGDGLTNPKDGRGPLRKSVDSSCKLPLHTGAPKPNKPH